MAHFAKRKRERDTEAMKPSVINSNNNSSNDEDSIADGLRQEEAEFGPFKVRYITKKFSTEETFYRRK